MAQEPAQPESAGPKPPHWWEVLLGSGALVFAAAIYLGHSTLTTLLEQLAGYQGPLGAIYGQEDVLMMGVSVLLNHIAPRLAISAGVAVGLFGLPQRALLISVRALGTLFLVFAATFPIGALLNWSWFPWLHNHELVVTYPLFVAICLGTLATGRGVAVGAFLGPWATKGLLLGGWLFLLWLVPLLLPSNVACFPAIKLHLNDGTVESSQRFINHHNGSWILVEFLDSSGKRLSWPIKERPSLRVRFVPDSRVERAVLGTCADPVFVPR